jgi:hypothetical protein
VSDVSEVDQVALPPLRYGLLLDSATVNGWQATVVEHLRASGDAELVVVVVRSSLSPRTPTGQRRVGHRRSLSERAGTALFRSYSTRLSRPRALRPSTVTPWSQTVSVVRMSPLRAEHAGVVFRPEDVEAIKAHGLEFLIAFGFEDLAGGALEASRLGVWRFQHGDARVDRGQPLGFWELVDGQSTVGAVLRREAEGPDRLVLRQGRFAVARESYALTSDRLLLGSAAWPAQLCGRIRMGIPGAPGQSLAPPAAGPGRTLNISSFLRFLAATTNARLRKYWHHGLRHDDWNIGVVDAPVATLLAQRSIPEVRWAPVRRGHYAADPFGRLDGASLEVFYEDYSRSQGFATIARRRWTRDGGWAPPEQALQIGSHLSYPFQLEHDGRRMMLPESRASGKLALYEADRTGATWRQSAELGLGRDVADSTLFHHADRWWLFAVGADRLNPATELFLWFADRPEGPWEEHPLNPILVDVRSARPAGPLFSVDGQLYRPAQDCSTGYGDRVAVKRILSLTTASFDEELVCFLEAARGGPFSSGLHTLTAVGDVTLVDGKRWAWSSSATARAIRRRLHV